jgi:hypothetical protein
MWIMIMIMMMMRTFQRDTNFGNLGGIFFSFFEPVPQSKIARGKEAKR